MSIWLTMTKKIWRLKKLLHLCMLLYEPYAAHTHTNAIINMLSVLFPLRNKMCKIYISKWWMVLNERQCTSTAATMTIKFWSSNTRKTVPKVEWKMRPRQQSKYHAPGQMGTAVFDTLPRLLLPLLLLLCYWTNPLYPIVYIITSVREISIDTWIGYNKFGLGQSIYEYRIYYRMRAQHFMRAVNYFPCPVQVTLVSVLTSLESQFDCVSWIHVRLFRLYKKLRAHIYSRDVWGFTAHTHAHIYVCIHPHASYLYGMAVCNVSVYFFIRIFFLL